MTEIKIRWSDIDANRHVANSAYINFMSYARVEEMRKAGVTQKVLEEYKLGPVVFYEHVYYYKEIMPDEPVYIDTRLKGLSKDQRFFQFEQNLYDKNGQNRAGYEMMGTWINMEKRKIEPLPEELAHAINHIKKTDDFKLLTKEDTRKYSKLPKHISLEEMEAEIASLRY